MIATPVQGDVDGISTRSHQARLQPRPRRASRGTCDYQRHPLLRACYDEIGACLARALPVIALCKARPVESKGESSILLRCSAVARANRGVSACKGPPKRNHAAFHGSRVSLESKQPRALRGARGAPRGLRSRELCRQPTNWQAVLLSTSSVVSNSLPTVSSLCRRRRRSSDRYCLRSVRG